MSMRIAIVMPHSLAGAQSGDRARTSHLVKSLRELGHVVDVIAPTWDKPYKTTFVDHLHRQILVGQRSCGLSGLARRAMLAGRRVYDQRALHHSRRLSRSLSSTINAGAYDVVDIQHSYWKLDVEAPVVVTTHNVQANSKLDRTWIVNRIVRRHHERRSLEAARRVVVFSGEEAMRCAAAHPGVKDKAHIVGIGFPAEESVDRAKATLTDPNGLRQVIFVGSMDYAPNRDAARSLISFWSSHGPRHALPNLLITGRQAHILSKRNLPSSVEIISDPDDLLGLYRASSAAIMTIQHGGGIRLKALEAMAYNVPIIGTALAVDGLGLEAGVSYLKAESEKELLEALNMTDEFILKSIASAAYERWLQVGHPRLMAEGMISVYQEAISLRGEGRTL